MSEIVMVKWNDYTIAMPNFVEFIAGSPIPSGMDVDEYAFRRMPNFPGYVDMSESVARRVAMAWVTQSGYKSANREEPDVVY